ncbi:M-phase phosphoprotein 6-like [Daktulosphaira vitifoliae]|uniref:M-phase phosphoprotein 6-like n=1 Tax=Daktulosphaira vitifoliae TaxID=58002 RepID=UPI0021A9DE61|nr:M-phase phosphoprotein 6-like [Daktulosphaira vitifoliae]
MGKIKSTKGEPRKNFSKALMKMKFMNPDVGTVESEVVIKSEHKIKKKDVVKTNSWELFYDLLPMARISFNGKNPDVESMMKKLGVLQRDPSEHGKMDVDMTVEEMIARKNKMKQKKK